MYAPCSYEKWTRFEGVDGNHLLNCRQLSEHGKRKCIDRHSRKRTRFLSRSRSYLRRSQPLHRLEGWSASHGGYGSRRSPLDVRSIRPVSYSGRYPNLVARWPFSPPSSVQGAQNCPKTFVGCHLCHQPDPSCLSQGSTTRWIP